MQTNPAAEQSKIDNDCKADVSCFLVKCNPTSHISTNTSAALVCITIHKWGILYTATVTK